MITTKQEIRILRNKTKSWLASLTYHIAHRDINLNIFSQRLRSLLKPVFKSELLQKGISDCISENIDTKEAAVIKRNIMSKLTPNKIYGRMLSYLRISTQKALIKDKPKPFTLGRLLIAWALLTDQSPRDFIVRVSPDITRLYKEWHNTTGCQGLSDEECYSHEVESARFLSGVCRTLVQATPEDSLIRFLHVGIKTLNAVIGTPGLEKEIYKLIGQVSRLVTKDAAQKIGTALKANPCAREKISIPELKALVLREEAKLGWSKNTEIEALNTLRGSLSPELKESADNSEVIRTSVEIMGRKGLFNNLLDALNGQLRPRFVENVKRFLKPIIRVESNWEFDTSNSKQENAGGVREWLFRR